MVRSLRREAPVVPAGIRTQLATLIEQEDRSAEITAGLVRVVAGVMLGAVAMMVTAIFPNPADAAVSHSRGGMLIVAGFVLSGLVAAVLARSRFYRRELAFATVALDAALIGFYLHLNLASTGFSGDLTATLPVVWLVPLFLTVAVLRIRPGLQLFGLVTFAGVTVAIVVAHGLSDPVSLQRIAGDTARFYAPLPNVMRLAMFSLAGALLVFAAHHGRSLLVRALVEAERRAALTKFLPAELTSLVTDAAADDLRRGRRQLAAILFVDIRDSTARAEILDPRRLSKFIASFRRRVTRAAELHFGVIDKFIGDGALVVFGLPESRPDDAARALACAKMLLRLVERWNDKRQFDPPVRVGIGVHVGEVFFGVIGDETRKELTVLGDAVNVAARLEQATKTVGTPLLASAEAVEAAGEAATWTETGREVLRGRAGITRLMQPA